MANNNKKEEILNWLNHFGRLAQSRFVGLLAIDYEEVKKLLMELESEGKIKREEETNAVYWLVNNES